MTSLFESKPIIPKTMKEMGIYGDYILEARGDECSQKDIITLVQNYDHRFYHYVITYMKNWEYTRLGKDWWSNKQQVFKSLLQSKYDKSTRF